MDGQTDQQKNKYAHLDQLSTEALEEFLRADIESHDNDNDDAIFYILEMIEEREKERPTGRLSDVDRAWADFQKNYNTPEGVGCSLYPEADDAPEGQDNQQARSTKAIRLRPALKLAALVAAVVVGIFGMMVTAQASGVDVFGAIGRWTAETFHFTPSSGGTVEKGAGTTPTPENLGYYDSLQSALEECGITEDLVPTWYPEGIESFHLRILKNEISDTINAYFTIENEYYFSFDVTLYQSAADLASLTFEKDSTPVEQYVSGTRTFYIMSNIDITMATWSNGLLMESIWGNLSVDTMKDIIDSIGGS